MKEVSILLPSVRPEALKLTINGFKATNDDVDYEIVVCSQFEAEGHKVKWVSEGPERLGSVSATNKCFHNSEGEHVIYFSDDVHPTYGCLKTMLDFVKERKDPFIGAFRMLNSNGRDIGPFGAYNKLYACYGCLSRYTVKKLGMLFHPGFMYSWVDIDLSLRCWETGGSVEICDEAIMMPRQIEDEFYKEHRAKYWDADVDTFFELWHGKLGEGYNKIEGEVNRRLHVQ